VTDEFPIIIPGDVHRRELKFTGDFKEAIFGKTIMRMPTPRLWKSNSVRENHEQYNDYTLNNYNYRGPDFGPDVDIITAGCSQTFGMGVPDNGPWPVHLAESLDASYVNLAIPGASVESIIDSVYRYMDTFGKPKRGIVILFPDLLRNSVVINSAINTATYSNTGDFIPQYHSDDSKLRLLSYCPMGYPAPTYIKRPYPIENTLVMEESVKTAVLKIKDLERFCKYAGIKLVWSSWSDTLVWLLRDIPEQYAFENYVTLTGLADWKSHITDLEVTEDDPEGIADYKLDHLNYSEITGCTEEMAINEACICFSRCHFDRYEEFKDSFHEGTDRVGKGNSHYGVHKHMHIAENLVAKAVEIGL
jgi:hypothetical protein